MRDDLLFLLIITIFSFAFGFMIGFAANYVHPCRIRAEHRTADGPDEAYCKAWDELEKQGKR